MQSAPIIKPAQKQIKWLSLTRPALSLPPRLSAQRLSLLALPTDSPGNCTTHSHSGRRICQHSRNCR